MKGIKLDKQDMAGAKWFVKKPIAIQAKQVAGEFWVESLEGDHQGKDGDYLMQGVRGEIYICDKDIFEETYTRQENIDVWKTNEKQIKGLTRTRQVVYEYAKRNPVVSGHPQKSAHG